MSHCKSGHVGITVEAVEFPGVGAESLLARVTDDLADAAADVFAILAAATTSLSRVQQGTWIAVLMDPDPSTSHVLVADDSDGAMATYMNQFVGALTGPAGTPTLAMSQRVIESSSPLLIPGVPFDEFISILSPAGQDYFVRHPPPVAMPAVGLLVVPMRVGGATIGTLGRFDWRQQPPLTEADVDPVQLVADHVALLLENARLHAAVKDQAERLAVVEGVAFASRVGQDLRLTLRVVVEQITARLRVDAADVLLATEQGDFLFVAASAGFHSSSIPDYRLPAGAWQSIPAGSRPHVENFRDLDRMLPNPRRSLYAREGFQSYVGLPLHARGRLVGVLEVYNRTVAVWDQASLAFLDTIGGIVTVAVDYAAASAAAGLDRVTGAPRPGMSDLEMEILRQIVEGLTNRDIAEKTHRSENTIKFHVRRILEKAGAANRTELARRATREGWL